MDYHGTSGVLFDKIIRYEGNGYAEFINPKIRVEGSIKIIINESGRSSVLMKMENIIVDGKPIESEIIQILLKNELDVGEYAAISKYLRLIERNTCSRLAVNTSEGIFSAEGEENIIYYYNGSKLVFSFLMSQFIASQELIPKYWSIVLQNFISDFSQGCPGIQHPLRANNPDCRVIKFEFNKSLGFIEPLSDYSQSKSDLINGSRNKMTAIMVGEIGDNSIELSDLGKWFPFDFLSILGVATGSEVSASWIEIRNEDGKLIRRIHPSFKIPCYSKGHVALDEFFNIGIGSLLTNYQFFPDRGNSSEESYFTAVLENLVKGALDNLTSEDKLSYIFRGLDCLCERYHLKTKDLRNGLDIQQKTNVENAIKCILQLGEKELLSIKEDARKSGKYHQAETIGMILGKLEQTQPYFDASFGNAVVNLMHKFSLNDAEIVESYYMSNPRWDNRKWAQVLPYYRGKTMHTGYIKFHEKKHFRKDVPRISRHLHDILLRIVLKMLDYKGTYQPTVKNFHSTDYVDWVSYGTYVFSWDEIPGEKNGELIEFLVRKFDIDWLETARIEKIDNGKTIKVYIEGHTILLTLNDDKSEVILKIYNIQTYKFVAKMEEDVLNIYYNTPADELGY